MLVESPVTGKYAHLDPRKYPLEIFFIHGHFSADLKILFIHGNKSFHITMKQHSHQFSQHDLFLLFFIFDGNHFLQYSRKNSQPGPVKHVFLWISCLRQHSIGYFSEYLSVKTMNYIQAPHQTFKGIKIYLKFESLFVLLLYFSVLHWVWIVQND